MLSSKDRTTASRRPTEESALGEVISSVNSSIANEGVDLEPDKLQGDMHQSGVNDDRVLDSYTTGYSNIPDVLHGEIKGGGERVLQIKGVREMTDITAGVFTEKEFNIQSGLIRLTEWRKVVRGYVEILREVRRRAQTTKGKKLRRQIRRAVKRWLLVSVPTQGEDELDKTFDDRLGHGWKWLRRTPGPSETEIYHCITRAERLLGCDKGKMTS